MTAYVQSTSETLTYSEALRVIASPQRISETLSTTDDPIRFYLSVRPISEFIDRTGMGNTSLPLLFTYGGVMDAVTRATGVQRVPVETLTTTDTVAAPASHVPAISETLTTSDAMLINQVLFRSIADTISLTDVVSLVQHPSRRFIEAPTRGVATSPMLLFTYPNWDVVTRSVTTGRINVETLHLTDVTRRVANFLGRIDSETLTFSEVLKRVVTGHRAGAAGVIETLSFSDAVSRAAQYQRTKTEALILNDLVLRRITTVRSIADFTTYLGGGASLPLLFTIPTSVPGHTNDILNIYSFKARSITETLHTSDRISLVQLLASIMGYIWVDSKGHAISQLPDWGFILVEDPTLGNWLDWGPIPIQVINPMREK